MSSTELARDVVTQLVRGGVTELIVCPGSRNAPLSFAAYDAADAGLVRLHTRIDERTAGFLAIGLTRNGRRAAVICTSGTAVMNLHPALREAAHSGVRIVVVTADRPERLRFSAANQTTEQDHVFDDDMVEVVSLSDADPALAGTLAESLVKDSVESLAEHLTVSGPCHINVHLEEPLVPPDRWQVPPLVAAEPASWLRAADYTEIGTGPRTVVVAGADAAQPARRLAEAGAWPLLAEPSSGSRTGEHALRCYRLLLDTELGARVERVVAFGRPTLSRPVTRLLAREDVEVLSVEPRGVWTKRPFRARTLTGGLGVSGADDPEWLEEWRRADRSVARQLDRLLAEEPELTPHEVAGIVARALPPGGLLTVGASSPIRDLDLMAPAYPVGERRKVVANRGLAGIDGTVSTAIGAALARPDEGRKLALMGDVTFLHDSTGLVLGPDEPRPDLTIVVVNDDGGSIFTMLEQGGQSYADRYERLFGTPHHVDIAALCAATRTPHLRVASAPELEQALASPNGGVEVVEVVVRRDNRRSLDERIRALRP